MKKTTGSGMKTSTRMGGGGSGGEGTQSMASIWLTGLSERVESEHVAEMMASFGAVAAVEAVGPGTFDVAFTRSADAALAVERMDGAVVDGEPVSVWFK